MIIEESEVLVSAVEDNEGIVLYWRGRGYRVPTAEVFIELVERPRRCVVVVFDRIFVVYHENFGSVHASNAHRQTAINTSPGGFAKRGTNECL